MNSEKATRIAAGTVAGWSIVTVGQPLDYLKTLYQTRENHLPSIKEIYRDIGFKGFYKGASSIYLFAGVVTALQFQTFQRTSNRLSRLGLVQGQKPSIINLMLSGFVTGAVCSFVYTPTQYAKIHSQIGRNTALGSAAFIFRTLRDQKLRGLKKLYTGHTTTLVKQSFGSVMYYGGYHVTLTRIFKQNRENAQVWAQVISGGTAGVLYMLYSYPIDTIKTNIQSGNKGFVEMLRSKFWNTSNFKNGLKISLLRSFIVDATNFTVYQNLRHYLYRGYQKIYQP